MLYWLIDPVAVVMGVYSINVVPMDTPAVLSCHGLSSLSRDLNAMRGICTLWLIGTCDVHSGIYIIVTAAAQMYTDTVKKSCRANSLPIRAEESVIIKCRPIGVSGDLDHSALEPHSLIAIDTS